MDVVRAQVPSLPTTQPLAVPLELGQAARIVLHDPIYLSKARGDLWITRPDAPPTPEVLRAATDPNAEDPQTHVLRDRVEFVHWMPLENGTWLPYLVCRRSDGTDELVWQQGRSPLPEKREFRWDRAFSWDDKVVVPSRTGVSVLQFRPRIREWYCDLAPHPGPTSAQSAPTDAPEPQALPDGQGLLAWVPWDAGKAGGRGAARFEDGRWTDLGPDQGWAERLVHLVPLLDGTVFEFFQREDGSITVQTTSLSHGPVDEQAIKRLVEQLSDADPEVRRKAFADLSNFGPGAWPVMEKLAADQSPQARLLLRQLLRDHARPTLSGMTLLGSRSLQLAARLSDGGVVFYAEQGVSIPEPDGEETTTAPAWLSIRPGHYVELLPPLLVADLKAGQTALDVVGDQWVVTSDVRGPRLFYGNGFATLLRKDERKLSRVIGMDQRGRWLFRESGRDSERTETLIIDPHLPDSTPRLPVWQLAIADTVGWDKDNWPVLKHGGAFALTESGWRPLGEDEKVFTRSDEIPSAPALATAPSTRPSTAPAVEGAGEAPILVAPDGTRYYGGLKDLRVARPDGKRAVWSLPAIANGSGPVCLIRARDGKLFLFNQPGRVLRIEPTPAGPEPFKLEATFTHNVPVVSHPTRIWLDPADRIDIAWENRLAILFPEGYIPGAISKMMLEQSGLDADNP